jgi:bifunctional DNA-binding transcriptional regulator/antitoxin component of YhaV-PrlF toxin-antitoxin module
MPRIAIVRVCAKARLLVPRRLRECLGIGVGDRLLLGERHAGSAVRPVSRDAGEDPFPLFTEWSSEADARAYDDL